MSTQLDPLSNPLSMGQQRKQANILLLRLQWLFILLLALALVWLYVSQQLFENQVLERLQSNEQVTTRLNEMDDRLFAISQQASPAPRLPVTSQAQNQLDLLRIQMQAANSLLADNNYQATINLLEGIQWQLSQDNNEIAPALNIVINQSLSEDIERLQAQSTQPSPWQLQNLAIRDIQAFLHDDGVITKSATAATNNNQQTKLNNKTASAILTRRQLVIHEVVMTLNLAIQASNMRERDQLTDYLNQARAQLQSLEVSTVPISTNQRKTATANSTDTSVMDPPNTIGEVVIWLDELINNTPTTTPLLTTQILDQPTR